jgi:hypothetical protein
VRHRYRRRDSGGLEHFLPTAKRVEVLARLCAEGYAGKMVLSHDANCWTDMVSEDDKRRTRPLWHYTHISDDILPALQAAGVTEDPIEQTLVENPRAIVEASGRRGAPPRPYKRRTSPRKGGNAQWRSSWARADIGTRSLGKIAAAAGIQHRCRQGRVLPSHAVVAQEDVERVAGAHSCGPPMSEIAGQVTVSRWRRRLP